MALLLYVNAGDGLDLTAIEIHAAATVGDVEASLSRTPGWEDRCVRGRLQFAGTSLDDALTTLADLGVCNEAVLRLAHDHAEPPKAAFEDFEGLGMCKRRGHVCCKITGREFFVLRFDPNRQAACKQTSPTAGGRLPQYERVEAQLLERANHPFVIRVHHTIQRQEKLWLLCRPTGLIEIFEWQAKRLPTPRSGSGLSGGTESEAGLFSEIEAKFFFAQMAEAVGYVQTQLGRDPVMLLPSSFSVDSTGYCCLTDVQVPNLAKRISAIYPAEYSAPEWVRFPPSDEVPGRGTPWWELGAILYEMLVGCTPYEAEDAWNGTEDYLKRVQEDPFQLQLESEGAEFSERLQDLCLQLLHSKQKTRLQGCAALRRHPFYSDFDWEALLNRHMEVPPCPDRPPRRLPTPEG